MESAISLLAASHSHAFIAGAACLCAIAVWLVLSLRQRAHASSGGDRCLWMAAIALVGGFGVWTTHFIAMLGFRPALSFGYDASQTALSALIAIASIGVPLAATVLTRRRWVHVLCGVVAGGGVAAMHFTAMQALQGCIASHAPGITTLSSLLGIALFAAALSVWDRRRCGPLAVALIVGAVCLVHFVAMIGLSLTPIEGHVPAGTGAATLGMIVVVAAIGLLLMAWLTAISAARLDRHKKLGALLGAALANMSNGLLVIDPQGRISLLNDRLLKLFQIGARQAAVGMRWEDYLTHLGAHLGWDTARTKRVIDNHSAWFAKTETTYLEHGLNDGRVISVACRPMADGGAVLTYDDVTVERTAQKAFEQLAFLDPLTSLGNRRAFQGDLAAALESGEDIALFLIDLDRFKVINDTLGHAVGDEVLVAIGRRLQAAGSPRESAYRLGGDELALIARQADEAHVLDLAAQIIGDASEPQAILGHSIVLECSVGMATTADTRDAATLIQYADLALFKAKANGRRQSRSYESGMLEAATERRRIEADIRLALANDQFHLLYQPLCRLPDRRIVGFEALIRWNHPEQGWISPARFIPVAEEAGLITQIGEWVLMEACREAASWPGGVHVAVNASPVQLMSKAFPLLVAKTLAACHLDPARLCIELTETALVEDGDQIAAALQLLRELGVRVAMDDFGTGYSSFAHLVDFHLDKIKIDRTFVQEAPGKPSAMAVVKAVIQMGRDLGVGTIGEGVETAEQLELLTRLGCDEAQGYLLGRPLTRLDALRRLAEQEPAAFGDALAALAS